MKYPAIQILRFIAASFVVVDHAMLQAIQNWPSAPLLQSVAWSFGDVGVIVFFAVSGFIMVKTQYQSFGKPRAAIDFLLRRIIRIVPIYAIVTTIEYLHRFHNGPEYNLANYARSLLFLPYMANGGMWPILGQGWTLNYEMFFYLVFALSLCLPRSRGLSLCIGLFCLLVGLGNFVTTGNVPLNFYMKPILLYFVCGMLIALLEGNRDTKSTGLLFPMVSALSLMTLTVVLSAFLSTRYYLPLSLISVFVCVYICATYRHVSTSKVQASLERLGDASYSTYLFHGFILGGSIQFLLSDRIAQNQYFAICAFVILCVATANLGGLVAYRFIEKPITSFLNKRYRRYQLTFAA